MDMKIRRNEGTIMTYKSRFAASFVAAVCASPTLAAAPAPLPFNTVVTKQIQPQAERLLVDLAREGRNLKIDGIPVFNGGDKFLTGKIALGLIDFISALPDNDPRLPGYLKNFRDIAKLTVDDPNDSWGIYYYISAIDRLERAGRLQQAIDPLTLAKLRVRLDWRSFVDLESYELIDHPNNYYCVAFAIARLRAKLGWETREGADRLYTKMIAHYPKYSGENGFADETNGDGRFDRYSVLLAGEVAQRFLQTGEQPPKEVLAWLRKSADVMLHRVNREGYGFEYGRSIGPYGETSIIEVLTAAAATNVLTEQEKQLAYAFSSRVAERYVNFWIDAKTGSVNLWDNGRRTDAYRGKFRILGENLSLAHQFVYTNENWNKLGFQDKVPTNAYWAGLNSLPKETVTWFSQGKYDRLLLTRREGDRIISLPIINGASTQHNHSPYFPIPFSPGMLEAVPDGDKPLMVPQIKLADGSTLMPLAYFRNARVERQGAKTVVSFSQTELDKMGGRAPVADARIAVATRYEFQRGKIRRTDVFTPVAPIDVQSLVMEFGTFSALPVTRSGVTDFATGAVKRFAVTGLPDCVASAVNGQADYQTSIGAMNSKVLCQAGARQISAPFTISWEITYK
jgi:hypothetical protein